MPKICYKEVKFQRSSLETLQLATAIIDDFSGRGFDLTLRQLYYQLVARGYIENTQASYKRVGSLINDARLAGLIDWEDITDRTRNMKKNNHWTSPRSIIEAAIDQYRINTRQTQPNYIEVWVEKEALEDVVGKIAYRLDVPYLACRGYMSQSEMWAAAQRFIERDGQNSHIIHLGDHDPSGVDMTRDIEDRMDVFGAAVEVHRIALNFDQVEQYTPPPNPAKITDSRAASYISTYGKESWELDALDPAIIQSLIEREVNNLTDFELWREAQRRQTAERQVMAQYADKLDLDNE